MIEPGALYTAPSVAACLDLLEQVGATRGSACLTVTDGRPEPNGTMQLAQIEQKLAAR